MIDVILRTCDNCEVHSGKRIVDVLKSELILKCLTSLINNNVCSMKKDVRLTVVDDHSSLQTVEKINDKLATLPNTKFLELPEPRGNGNSMRFCYQYAITDCSDMIYFVEDDYLHYPGCLKEMIESYSLFKERLPENNIVLSPTDDPVDYRPDRIELTRIVLGSTKHWRLNDHTCWTSFMHKYTLIHYWDLFMKFCDYDNNRICEDNTINLIYRDGKTLLFSPIPSLAVHMQFIEPPVVDWKEVWNNVN